MGTFKLHWVLFLFLLDRIFSLEALDSTTNLLSHLWNFSNFLMWHLWLVRSFQWQNQHVFMTLLGVWKIEITFLDLRKLVFQLLKVVDSSSYCRPLLSLENLFEFMKLFNHLVLGCVSYFYKSFFNFSISWIKALFLSITFSCSL